MAQTLFTRLFGRSRGSNAARPTPRRTLAVEALEDRLTPSGGPGPSGASGGGGPGSSNSPAIVAGAPSGSLVTGVSGKTYQLGSVLTALNSGGMSISQLFSGYPLAPGGGPALQNNLVVLSDPTSVPWSMQNSTVAVIPLLLTTTSSGSGSQSYTLVLYDTSTGLTYSVAVNMQSPTPPLGGGGPPAPAP